VQDRERINSKHSGIKLRVLLELFQTYVVIVCTLAHTDAGPFDTRVMGGNTSVLENQAIA